MPIVNRQTLDDANKSYRALFKDRFDKAPVLWPLVAMEATSTGSEETYAWLGAVPMVREWVGPRVVESLKAEGYTIKNKKWANAIAVGRDEIEDDKLGMVRPRLEDLADAAAYAYDQVVFQMLSDGFTLVCYDTLSFYNAAHRDDPAAAAQSNRSVAPLSATSFRAARAAMRKFTDYRGNELGILPDTLVVGPDLESTAEEILVADKNAAGATNVDKGKAKIVVSPWLKTATEWHLLCTSRAVRALILQKREPFEFQAQEDPNNDSVFNLDEFHYGTRGRHNAGFGLWQLAYGSTGTG